MLKSKSKYKQQAENKNYLIKYNKELVAIINKDLLQSDKKSTL